MYASEGKRIARPATLHYLRLKRLLSGFNNIISLSPHTFKFIISTNWLNVPHNSTTLCGAVWRTNSQYSKLVHKLCS